MRLQPRTRECAHGEATKLTIPEPRPNAAAGYSPRLLAGVARPYAVVAKTKVRGFREVILNEQYWVRTTVLPYDLKAAAWLGEERARLAGIGRPAPRTDGEIAAIAVSNGLTLVTRNTRDFEGFAGLALHDWFSDEPAR